MLKNVIAIVLMPDNARAQYMEIPKITVDEDGKPGIDDVDKFLRSQYSGLHPTIIQDFLSITSSSTEFNSRMHIFAWGDWGLPLHIQVCDGSGHCDRTEDDVYWRTPVVGICVSEQGEVLNAKEGDGILLMSYFRE